MPDLESLPPDQRAALQLLLKQGQSYQQLGELLAIDADAVRRRAHAALETLGAGAGTELGADERAQVGDYLLGQQTVSQRERARDLLASSPSAREWAQSVAGALRDVAPDALPEVPSAAPPRPPEVPSGAAPPRAAEPEPPEPEPRVPPEPEPAGFERPPARERRPARARTPVRERARAGLERAGLERAGRERPAPGGPARPSSRLGGALLLGGVAILVTVLLVVIIGGGDDGGNGSTLSTRPSTQTGTNQSRPVAQINLFSPRGGSRTVGLAQVYEQGRRRAVVVAGQGLSPGAYALWLSNSPTDARLLGFVPQRVGRDGRFATQGELPDNAERFRRLIVTRENVTRNTRRPPTRPGATVLQGDLKLR